MLFFLKNARVHANLVFSSVHVSNNQEAARASLITIMHHCAQCERKKKKKEISSKASKLDIELF